MRVRVLLSESAMFKSFEAVGIPRLLFLSVILPMVRRQEASGA